MLSSYYYMSSLHSFLGQSSSYGCAGWAHHTRLLHHVWILSRFVAWTAIRLIEGWILLVTHWHLLTLHGLVVSTTLMQIVTRNLVWTDHRKHFRETLPHSGNSLWGVTEWQLVPWHEVGFLTVHVGEAFLAWGARKSTKRLSCEHCILLSIATSSTHDKIVQVLELLLVDPESLVSIGFVGKLFGQLLNDLGKSFGKSLVKLLPVCLLIELVLQSLNQFHNLISEHVESIFKVCHSLLECIKSLLTDTIVALLGILLFLEFLNAEMMLLNAFLGKILQLPSLIIAFVYVHF